MQRRQQRRDEPDAGVEHPPPDLVDEPRRRDRDEHLREPDHEPVPVEHPVERDQEEAVQRLRVGRRDPRDEAVRPAVEERLREVVALVDERRGDVAPLDGEREQARQRARGGEQEVGAGPGHARTSVRSRARSGRLLPRRAAARRRRLGALLGARPRPARRVPDRGARPAARRRGRGRAALARARPLARRAVRTAHALDVAVARAPDRTATPPSASVATSTGSRARLEPRYFPGGGWYTDDGRSARRSRRRASST